MIADAPQGGPLHNLLASPGCRLMFAATRPNDAEG